MATCRLCLFRRKLNIMTGSVILRFRRQRTDVFYLATLALLLAVGSNGQTCSPTAGCAPPLGDLTTGRVINVTSGYQGNPLICTAALHTAGCLNDGDYTTSWSSAQFLSPGTLVFVTLNFPQTVTIENTSVWLPQFTVLRAFVLERSNDFGQTWTAYRYYASNCLATFAKNATGVFSPPSNTTEAICVEVWSMFQQNRADFSIESQLSAGTDTATIAGYRTVTNIRLKLVDPNVLLANYEILEWTVTGSCMCNGHASRCIAIHGDSNMTAVHSGCLCTAKPRKHSEKCCTYMLVTMLEGYTETNPEDISVAAYATIDDLQAAIRTVLTQSRSKDAEKPQEHHEYEIPTLDEHDLYSQLNKQSIKWIPRGEIRKSVKIGCGQFGDLHEGVWTSSGTECEVAIEALTSSNPDSKIKFLQEATIMAQLNHPNVIRLIGIITEDKPLSLIFELAHSCNLSMCLALLKAQMEEQGPTNAFGQLLSYSQQIACGLQYLSSKSLFHPDFSAQKVLVTESNICKIADVGKSQVVEEDYYVPGVETNTPLCAAPEAIHFKKYSTASDVWSYGCLLYEIWSVGHKPFEGVANENIIEKIDTGYRLPPPPGCPFMIYYIMIKCWNPDASSRPYFSDIHMSLSQNHSFVCHIPNEALITHPQAGVLGAPLETGKNMYLDIQNTYIIHP
eukprot:Em0011g729a